MKVPFFTMFDDLLLIVRHLLGAVGQPVMRQRWEEGGEEVRCLVPLHDRLSPGELHDLACYCLRRKDLKAGVDPLFAMQLVGTMVTHGLLRHAEAVTPNVLPPSPPPSRCLVRTCSCR